MHLHRRRFLGAASVSLALPCLDGFSPGRALAGAEEPRVVELWPGKPPEEPGTIGGEKTFPSKPNKQRSETTEVTRLITNVTKPTITLYRPAKEKDTGAALLICPGGGYHNLWWQLEGEEVATWLNSIGVTGILLKYRVPRRPDDLPGEHPGRRPLQDAQRAVSLVRSNAKAWGLDPQRIGIVGFSAGAISRSRPRRASTSGPTSRSTTSTR
jgi:acetyl esterase/lipase